jgi:hypothetical protein
MRVRRRRWYISPLLGRSHDIRSCGSSCGIRPFVIRAFPWHKANWVVPTLAILLFCWKIYLTLYCSLFTHPSTYIWIQLIKTKVSRALFRTAFVIASAGLSNLLIHWISNNSQHLYDWQIAIMLIIRHFSLVILSLTKYS